MRRATRRVDGEYGAASDFMDLKNEDSDFFFKGYLDIDQLKAGYAAASQRRARHARGLRRRLQPLPQGSRRPAYPAACSKAAWVRPITVEDMYLVIAEKALHASGEVFAREIVAGARDPGVRGAGGRARRAAQDRPLVHDGPAGAIDGVEKLGSNGLAIGKDLSASGRGILLGNPHYPWTSTDRFYQAHLTVPGRYDAMGVILGGIPMVVIGFNKDVAWTHTVTTAVHFTTFKLALDPGDASGTSYLSDGATVKMSAKPVTVESRMPDGSITSRNKTFYFSKQGAVLVKPEAGIAWTAGAVHVLADPNRNNTRLIDQWIGLGSAASVQEMKASLDTIVGLPWINTVAADRDGNTLYADASVVPRVGADKFAYRLPGGAAAADVRRLAQRLRLGPGQRRAGRHLRAGQRPVDDPHRLCRQLERQLLADQSARPVQGAGAVRLFAAVRRHRHRAEVAHPDRLSPARRDAGAAQEAAAGRRAGTDVRQPRLRRRTGAARSCCRCASRPPTAA